MPPLDHIHYFLIKMISLQKMTCKTLDICLKPQASFLRLMQLNMLDILVSYPDYHLQEQCKEHMVLDYVGLKDRYRDISDFSTGMKQRLLFAQSLIHDPPINYFG